MDVRWSCAGDGSGWKLVSVLPCPSNVVTALANGVMPQGVSNRSQAYLPGATCGGSWQVGLAPGQLWTLVILISHHILDIVNSIQNWNSIRYSSRDKWYTIYNYMILLLYTILLYDKLYTGLEGLLEGPFQYTSLYTVYE